MTILAPTNSWSDLLRGSNFDPNDDQQANSGNDLVGNAASAMLQTQIAGTGAETVFYMRARLGDATPSTAVYLGLDLNLDGRIDIFVEANRRTNSPYVSFHAADPANAGTGPSNTGWLSSTNAPEEETKLAAENFYFEANVTAGTDIDANNQTDSWYQFGFRFGDLQTFVALALNGQSLTLDTPVAIYAFTSTSQTSNGDTAGIDDRVPGVLSQSWVDLGIGRVGSLSDLLSGALTAPTVERLSTNDASPLLQGTWGGDLGGSDTLSVVVDGVTYTAQNGLRISGTNWSLQLTGLTAGTYSVTATTTRAGGGSAVDTTTAELVIVAAGDDVAPTLVNSDPVDGATGVARGADIVLTFSEEVVAANGSLTLADASGGVVEVFSLATGKGSLGGTITVSGTTVTINPGIILAGGADYCVLVGADALTDPSGNAYAGISAQTTLNFTTASDLGAPSVPVVDVVTASNQSAPLLTGSWGGSNGGVDTLTVTVNGVTYGVADGLVINGTSWSLQLSQPLESGSYEVVATASRSGGGTASDASATELSVVAYAGDPDAPVVDTQIAGSRDPLLTGTWGGSNGGSDSLSVTVHGVTYTTANGLVIDGTGWSIQLDGLVNGTYEVTATVTRIAGGTATEATHDELTVLVTAPETVATITTVEDDMWGTLGPVADGGRTDDTMPKLSGALSAPLATGETVEVYLDGVRIGTATTDGQTWEFQDPDLHAVGDELLYTVAVVDAEGHKGSPSAVYRVTVVEVDTGATITSISDDDGADPAIVPDQGMTEDRSPLIEGTLTGPLNEGEVLEIWRDGVRIGEAEVTGTGWRYQEGGLEAGQTYSYTAKVVSGDMAGTESADYTVTISTGSPQQPTVDVVGGDDTSPLITGTWGGPNGGTDVLTVTVDGQEYTTANGLVLNEDGTWQLQLPELPDGTYEVVAQVHRDGGSTSTDSSQDEVVVDTTPPETTATITQVSDDFGLDKGPVGPGGTTDDLTPTLSGTLSAPLQQGETVLVLRDGEVIGTAEVTGTGWRFTDPSAPNRSTADYTVLVQDGFGNQGTGSAAREVVFAGNAGIGVGFDAAGLDRLEGTLPLVNGQAASTDFTLVIHLDEPLLAAAALEWRVAALGAHGAEAEDFIGYSGVLPRGTLRLEAGATEAEVTIRVRSDAAWAYDQAFKVLLSSSDTGLVLPSTTISGVIRNDDAMAGSNGNERLVGTDLADTINANGGDDLVRGLEGDDWLYGGTGNDTLDGGSGNDLLSGGDGVDVVDLSAAAEAVTVDLGSGTMRVPAAFGADTLSGIEGAIGGSGNDSLTGTAAANWIAGGAGDDVILGGGGNDSIDGGDGWDRLSFEGATAALSVDLSQIKAQPVGGGTVILVQGIEELAGGAGNDSLTGTAGANRIEGAAGDDMLNGGDGADTLVGGAGNDVYLLGDAGDVVQEDAGGGLDRIRSTRSMTLWANVEELELIGLNAQAGTGNTLDNLIVGNGIGNLMSGLSGRDTLDGKAGADTLLGGEGDDLFIVSASGDVVAGEVIGGEEGQDELRFAATTAGTLVLTAGTAVERVVIGTGLAATAVSSGTLALGVDASAVAGALTLAGNAGANALTGTAFDDSIDGGAGNDTLAGGAGDDVLSGGTGLDIASYAAATEAVTLSLALSQGQQAGNLGTDRLLSIEGIIGGAGNDRLTGDGNANALTGGAGNDTLDGGAGNDSLIGGSGSDAASYASAGAAVVVNLGLSGAAQATGGAGSDTLLLIEDLVGSDYADALTGNGGANRIAGGAGADTVTGGTAADTLLGDGGDDLFIVASAADVVAGEIIDGGEGQDEVRFAAAAAGLLVLTSGTAVERVVLGSGTAALAVTTATTALSVDASAVANGVTITGNAGANTLTGSAFADSIDGGAGNDILAGGAGDDTLNGGSGTDMASYAPAVEGLTLSLAQAGGQSAGSLGTDRLVGIEGITGGSGADSLTGDGNANTLLGGAGNDTLDGGAGNDTLSGGDGTDTASYAQAGAGVTVSLALLTAQATGSAGTDTLSLIENLTGSAFGDMLAGGTGVNRIDGGTGADTLTGGAGADVLNGGEGDDVFIIATVLDHASGEVISGGAGTDELRFAALGSGTLTLAAATDVERVVIGTGTAAAAVTTGTVSLNVNASALNAGVTITGNSGTNLLTGSNGDDSIDGGAGNDTLAGGRGNDTLSGGAGSDRLTGGEGADVFVFAFAASGSNRDTITDVDTAADRIWLAKSVFAGLSATGTLAEGEFWSGAGVSAAHDASDRLVYNTTSGALFYDADGSGAAAAVQVAQLSAGLALAAEDFFVF